MDKEQLFEQLLTIKKQEQEIRKQLDLINYKERLNDAKQYQGRYFREINPYYKESIKCVFVYATDIEHCNPMAICVSYWIGNEKSNFGIEYYGHFHLKNLDDNVDNWIEISKDEYQHHYREVQKRISLAVS